MPLDLVLYMLGAALTAGLVLLSPRIVTTVVAAAVASLCVIGATALARELALDPAVKAAEAAALSEWSARMETYRTAHPECGGGFIDPAQPCATPMPLWTPAKPPALMPALGLAAGVNALAAALALGLARVLRRQA